MQIVPYLNKDGYLPGGKPFRIGKETYKKSFSPSRSVAKYILCPETGTLKYLLKCEDCQLFKSNTRKGVRCGSANVKEIPPYYAQSFEKEELEKWKKKKQRSKK